MMQTGLFDWHDRFEKLNQNGDPLLKLNQVPACAGQAHWG